MSANEGRRNQDEINAREERRGREAALPSPAPRVQCLSCYATFPDTFAFTGHLTKYPACAKIAPPATPPAVSPDFSALADAYRDEVFADGQARCLRVDQPTKRTAAARAAVEAKFRDEAQLASTYQALYRETLERGKDQRAQHAATVATLEARLATLHKVVEHDTAEHLNEVEALETRLVEVERERDEMLRELADVFPGSRYTDRLAGLGSPSQHVHSFDIALTDGFIGCECGASRHESDGPSQGGSQ
jgi:hypothetical protein